MSILIESPLVQASLASIGSKPRLSGRKASFDTLKELVSLDKETCISMLEYDLSPVAGKGNSWRDLLEYFLVESARVNVFLQTLNPGFKQDALELASKYFDQFRLLDYSGIVNSPHSVSPNRTNSQFLESVRKEDHWCLVSGKENSRSPEVYVEVAHPHFVRGKKQEITQLGGYNFYPSSFSGHRNVSSREVREAEKVRRMVKGELEWLNALSVPFDLAKCA